MKDETKIPVPLNLPKKKNQFETVSFVDGMTEFKLKVFIKRLWEQLMALSNVLDTRHKDIPSVLDKIMSGKQWTKKDIHDRYQYGIYRNVLIEYDTLERVFNITDHEFNHIHPTVKAMSLTDIKKGKINHE